MFITCLGASILELWSFPAPPVLVLLPLPGIQGGKVLQTPILPGFRVCAVWGFHKDVLAAGRNPQALETEPAGDSLIPALEKQQQLLEGQEGAA